MLDDTTHDTADPVTQMHEMFHEVATLARLDPDNPGPDVAPAGIPAAEWEAFLATGAMYYDL